MYRKCENIFAIFLYLWKDQTLEFQFFKGQRSPNILFKAIGLVEAFLIIAISPKPDIQIIFRNISSLEIDQYQFSQILELFALHKITDLIPYSIPQPSKT